MTPTREVVADRRKDWGRLVPGLRVFARAEDLLREPLDGVVVEGRVYENLQLARLALESGRPVMLEKPAGTDLDEFRRLIELAQRKHLHVQMIYLFRYMSAMVDLVERVRGASSARSTSSAPGCPRTSPRTTASSTSWAATGGGSSSRWPATSST